MGFKPPFGPDYMVLPKKATWPYETAYAKMPFDLSLSSRHVLGKVFLGTTAITLT